MRQRVVHVSFDLLDCTRVDHRTDLRLRATRRTDFQRADAGCKLSAKLFVDRLLHVDPIRAHAGLAAIAELGAHQTLNGRIDVCVVEHDERSVAAQLER